MYRQISFHTQSQQSTTQPLLTKYNIHDNNNGKNDKNRSTSIIFVSFLSVGAIARLGYTYS